MKLSKKIDAAISEDDIVALRKSLNEVYHLHSEIEKKRKSMQKLIKSINDNESYDNRVKILNVLIGELLFERQKLEY